MADPIVTDTYVFYWQGVFSQWYPAALEMNGITFNCAEQAMMYFKACMFGDEALAQKILGTDEPSMQKALGRQVRGFDSAVWDEKKRELVKRINFAKFDQNKGLRRKLFQTGERLLVEASPLDEIWGIGLDAETAAVTLPSEWPGQNLLGKVQTEVRDELRAKYPDEFTALA